MKNSNTFALVIPALDPNHQLINLLSSIHTFLQEHEEIKQMYLGTILVNDGSSAQCSNLFDIAEKEYHCVVLSHAINLGKGRALKTAFNYFLSHYQYGTGVVTLDADGQHDAEDVFACATALCRSQKNLVMGCRNFNSEDVPFQSRTGNKITRKVFSALNGIKLSDTQTGLRGIPTDCLRKFMNVPGERFEYEMNMLISCKDYNIGIEEVSIKTIYLEDNKSSHFRPLLDSIQVYKVFLMYIFAGLSSFLIDIFLFNCFVPLFILASSVYYISLATVTARVFSAFYNFNINKKIVFGAAQNSKSYFIKYCILVSVQTGLSALLVTLLYPRMPFPVMPVKIIVDLSLFVLNYFIQRIWVFNKESI